MNNKEAEEQLKIEQGKRMSTARFKLGYPTITTFAKELGISEATISAIERYERKISRKVFNVLEDKFKNLNIEWLRTGEGDMLNNVYKSAGYFSIVKEEKQKSYQHICEECRKKELKILELYDEIIQLAKEKDEEIRQLRKERDKCISDLSGLQKSSG